MDPFYFVSMVQVSGGVMVWGIILAHFGCHNWNRASFKCHILPECCYSPCPPDPYSIENLCDLNYECAACKKWPAKGQYASSTLLDLCFMHKVQYRERYFTYAGAKITVRKIACLNVKDKRQKTVTKTFLLHKTHIIIGRSQGVGYGQFKE